MKTHSKRLETTLSEEGFNILRQLEKDFTYYLGFKKRLGLGRTIELLMCVRRIDVENIVHNLRQHKE